MNFRRLLILSVATSMAFPLLTACSDSNDNQGLGELTPAEDVFGKANDVFSAEEWYPGGQLGTTEKASYSADAPAVDLIPGGNGLADFTTGEDFFEHLYTFEQAPRKDSDQHGCATAVLPAILPTVMASARRTTVPTPSATATCSSSITRHQERSSTSKARPSTMVPTRISHT